MVELSNLPSCLVFQNWTELWFGGLVVDWKYAPSMNAEVSLKAVAKLEEWFGGWVKQLAKLLSFSKFDWYWFGGLVVDWKYAPSTNAEVSLKAVAKLEEWFGGWVKQLTKLLSFSKLDWIMVWWSGGWLKICPLHECRNEFKGSSQVRRVVWWLS